MTSTAKGLRARLRIVSAAFATLLLASAAQATETYTSNLAVGSGVTFTHGGGVTTAPASYTVGGGNDVATSVSSRANGGSVTSTATSDLLSSTASTKLEFTARLVGPDGPLIRARVIANGSATGTGLYGTSSAYFTLEGYELLTGSAFYYHGLPGFSPSFAIDTMAFFQPNRDFIVTMYATAGAGDTFIHIPVSAFATVDPMFIVDPAFASAYHFEGIPAELTGGIPEPDSWALMITGFGLVGSMARRRRTGLAPA
jgi:hypothetical protein